MGYSLVIPELKYRNNRVQEQMIGQKLQYNNAEKYYSALRKHEIIKFAAMWTDLGSIMLNKVSQKEGRDTDCSHPNME